MKYLKRIMLFLLAQVLAIAVVVTVLEANHAGVMFVPWEHWGGGLLEIRTSTWNAWMGYYRGEGWRHGYDQPATSKAK